MTITLESPIKIRKRILSFFSSNSVKEELEEKARNSLLALEGLKGTRPLQLVEFYQIVSPWCDRSAELYQLERSLARIDYGQYNKAREALVALAAQDERAPYGVNRAISGEIPTAENVFLGNRCGLWTKTVAYWEATRAEYTTQPAAIGLPHPTVMEVIDAQASTFLNQGIARWVPILRTLIDS